MKSKCNANLSTHDALESSVKTEWTAKVTELLPELLYPSESDEPIEWFELAINAEFPLKINDLKNLGLIKVDTLIEEISPDDFWIPVITPEDWFGDEEFAQLHKFGYLKQTIDEYISKQQVFKIGEIEKDLWLIGPLQDSRWGGLKTKVVES